VDLKITEAIAKQAMASGPYKLPVPQRTKFIGQAEMGNGAG